MFVQPQHQEESRALARESAGSRLTGAPAYYLGRPASLWRNVTGPGRQVRRTPAAVRAGVCA